MLILLISIMCENFKLLKHFLTLYHICFWIKPFQSALNKVPSLFHGPSFEGLYANIRAILLLEKVFTEKEKKQHFKGSTKYSKENS